MTQKAKLFEDIMNMWIKDKFDEKLILKLLNQKSLDLNSKNLVKIILKASFDEVPIPLYTEAKFPAEQYKVFLFGKIEKQDKVNVVNLGKSIALKFVEHYQEYYKSKRFKLE